MSNILNTAFDLNHPPFHTAMRSLSAAHTRRSIQLPMQQALTVMPTHTQEVYKSEISCVPWPTHPSCMRAEDSLPHALECRNMAEAVRAR